MPLRPARPGEEPELLRMLSHQPLYNLFHIGNLREGLSDALQVWVQDGVGMLMRRRENWICDPGPNPDAFDYDAAAAIIDRWPVSDVKGLTGRPESVTPIFERLSHHHGKVYEQRFAALEQPPAPMAYRGTPRPARPEDLEGVVGLYADADDLTRSREAVERMMWGTWVMEDQGRIVATACCTARTEQAAMVVAVFTPPALRKRGYASGLVHALSVHLLEQGLTPCLFYHNPDAGRIYLRLGYRELGPWQMVRFAGH